MDTLRSVISAIMVQISVRHTRLFLIVNNHTYSQGIYPTAIIVLAALQNAAWDMSVGKEMSRNAPRPEMRLAPPNFRSVTSTGVHEPHASGAEVEHGEV